MASSGGESLDIIAGLRAGSLWDCGLTLGELCARLEDPDPRVRAYWAAKVMRLFAAGDLGFDERALTRFRDERVAILTEVDLGR